MVISQGQEMKGTLLCSGHCLNWLVSSKAQHGSSATSLAPGSMSQSALIVGALSQSQSIYWIPLNLYSTLSFAKTLLKNYFIIALWKIRGRILIPILQMRTLRHRFLWDCGSHWKLPRSPLSVSGLHDRARHLCSPWFNSIASAGTPVAGPSVADSLQLWSAQFLGLRCSDCPQDPTSLGSDNPVRSNLNMPQCLYMLNEICVCILLGGRGSICFLSPSSEKGKYINKYISKAYNVWLVSQALKFVLSSRFKS